MGYITTSDTPKPDEEGKGWMKNYAGDLEPIWSYGDILPPSLVGLIEDDGEEEDNGEENDGEGDEDLVEEVYDFDEILEYMDDEDDE